MKPAEIEALAGLLRRGERPPGLQWIKENPVRRVIRTGEVVLKVFLGPSRAPRREARALRKAAALGVPVPELICAGPDWIATRWLEGREALRGDLARILPVVSHMHRQGMLHGDLHLGNLRVQHDRVVVIDTQRSRFWPYLPPLLRHWELGRLAYSLGEPAPAELAPVELWRRLRAHQHGRSRTRRCLKESSGFTAFRVGDAPGFRRRDTSPDRLRHTLDTLAQAELIWPRPGGQLYRSGSWVVKQHASWRAARRAWVAGHGLESRGFRTARPVAWTGRWLIMEDAGPTIVEWIESHFAGSSPQHHEEMMGALTQLLSDLHRRGIYHADLKACNIIWAPGQPARLLDYEHVHFGLRVSRRRRTKNLAQLNSALPDVVPGSLRERGLRRYIEGSRYPGALGPLRKAVISQSLRRAHRWHGC